MAWIAITYRDKVDFFGELYTQISQEKQQSFTIYMPL